MWWAERLLCTVKCLFLQVVVLSADCSYWRWLHVFIFISRCSPCSSALINAWNCVLACVLQRNYHRCVFFFFFLSVEASCVCVAWTPAARYLLGVLFRDVGAAFRCGDNCWSCSRGLILCNRFKTGAHQWHCKLGDAAGFTDALQTLTSTKRVLYICLLKDTGYKPSKTPVHFVFCLPQIGTGKALFLNLWDFKDRLLLIKNLRRIQP